MNVKQGHPNIQRQELLLKGHIAVVHSSAFEVSRCKPPSAVDIKISTRVQELVRAMFAEVLYKLHLDNHG